MSKVLKFFSSILVYGLILVSTIIISLIVFYSNDLPNYDGLNEYFPPTVTKLYSSDNEIMGEYASEYRVFVRFDDIPKDVVNAFLAAEDASFYENPGIDHKGLFRALFQNLLNLGKKRSLVGGSTITQQVVKNLLLSDEKSIKRKVQEAILSFRLTNSMSKDRILELYLNQIFLGNRSYGVAAAAYNYFGKQLSELDLSESALLAALPKAPSKFNPLHDYDKALVRRNWVLGQMFEHQFITQQQLEISLAQPIELKEITKNSDFEDEYFTEEVRQIVVDQFGDDVVYKEGLSVYTTCDITMQQIAQESLQQHLIKYDQNFGYRGPIANITIDENWPSQLISLTKNIIVPVRNWRIAVVLKMDKTSATVSTIDGNERVILADRLKWTKRSFSDVVHVGDVVYIELDQDNPKNCELRQIPEVNGGVIIMEPQQGKVLALVGGFSYETSKFNRATQGIRQPGSAFKPFVYLAALAHGVSPASIIDDSPMELSQGRNLPSWRPKNYSNDYLGQITLRTALEKSRNIPAIKVAQKIGVRRISDLAIRFGIYDQPIRDLSSVLGSIDTTLLRLTNAYAIVANGGNKIAPIFIDRIQDRSGNILYKFDEVSTEDEDDLLIQSPNREKLVDEQSAYQLTSILHGATKHGTARKISELGITIAGKTGTTNDSKDAWFIGYTPDLVIGVYIGFDQPKSLGDKVTGSTLALPVFHDIARKLFVGAKDKKFTVPDGIKLVETGNVFEAYKEHQVPRPQENELLKGDPEVEALLNDLEKSDISEEYEQ